MRIPVFLKEIVPSQDVQIHGCSSADFGKRYVKERRQDSVEETGGVEKDEPSGLCGYPVVPENPVDVMQA